VIAGTANKNMKLLDVATGQVLQTFRGHAGWVSSVKFSPDGKRLLSSSGDSTLKVWGRRHGPGPSHARGALERSSLCRLFA
jgi:WD40 repeat protein